MKLKKKENGGCMFQLDVLKCRNFMCSRLLLVLFYSLDVIFNVLR
jgi:hypothetical protein